LLKVKDLPDLVVRDYLISDSTLDNPIVTPDDECPTALDYPVIILGDKVDEEEDMYNRFRLVFATF
jgi:hypothetical protein